MIRGIVADKELHKFLGKPSAGDFAKMRPEYIAELYKGAAVPSPAANPRENVPTATGPVKDLIGEIRELIRTIRDDGKVARAAKPEAPPASPAAPDTYQFADAKDRIEAGPTYKVQPPEERPASALPRATPVGPRPVAQPVSDAESPAGISQLLAQFIPGRLRPLAAAAAGGGSAAAGGAAAGLSGVAAAAGPLAIGLLAAEVASDQAAKSAERFTKRVEYSAAAIQQLAGNNAMGALSTAVDGAANELREIPIVGKAWAAELKATVAPIRAMHDVTAAFVARGKELADLSGPLAGANAVADVRSLMADMREADQLGPSLARLTDAQSRADTEIRELLLPIKELVITKLAAAIDAGLAGWDLVRPFFETTGDVLFQILDIVKATSMAFAGSEKMVKAIEDLIEQNKRGRELDERLKEYRGSQEFMGWLNAADNLGRGSPIGRNSDDEARRKIAGPIFPGFGQVMGM